jgi:hypothetical protein
MCIAADGKAISAKQIERLKAMKLAHLRVDLPLWEKNWPSKLKRAVRDVEALGAKLEIGLFVSNDAEGELQMFAGASSSSPLRSQDAHALLRSARHLVFHRDEKIPNARWLALARKHLGARAVIFGGTNMFFTELNRGRPDVAAMKTLDGLCYSFNPQVHAFDNASLAESPEAQAETIRTYKAFAKGKPLAITAITLKPRWSLGDPGPEPNVKAGDFDPRQMSLFGAGWTIASLKYVAQASGVTHATYYEMAGKRGVMDSAQVFPMYHVFADVAEFGGQGITTKTNDPLKVDGLALRKGKHIRALLTNLTDQTQIVALRGLGLKATVKTLDAHNAERAMKQPEAWRAEPGIALVGNAVELPPYAIARIDFGTVSSEI